MYELFAKLACPPTAARGLGSDADGFLGAVLASAVGDGFLPKLNQSLGAVAPLLQPEMPISSEPATAPTTDHRENEARMGLRPCIQLTLVVRRRLDCQRFSGNLGIAQ